VGSERLFYRVNALFCVGVAVHFLWSAGLLTAHPLPHRAEHDVERLLRQLAGGGPHMLILVSSLPVLLMISLMFAFYLYLHRRARYLSLLALLSGILLSGVLLVRQISEHQLIAVALRFVATTEDAARLELVQRARRLLDLHLMHSLLVNRASIVAYALYGFLFQKSRRLVEVIAGYLFLLSAVLLLLSQVPALVGGLLDLSRALGFPAFAFLLAAVVFFRARPDEE
jgi:hypothetical protein